MASPDQSQSGTGGSPGEQAAPQQPASSRQPSGVEPWPEQVTAGGGASGAAASSGGAPASSSGVAPASVPPWDAPPRPELSPLQQFHYAVLMQEAEQYAIQTV